MTREAHRAPTAQKGSLLITERFLPHQGGSRRYYHELAKRLPACTVLTGHERGDREFDRTAGVRIVRRAGVREDYSRKRLQSRFALMNVILLIIPKLIATLGWTLWEIRRARPALIHAGGYFFAGGPARVVRLLLGIPYVVYVHGEEVASALNSRHMDKYMRWVLRGADHIVANAGVTGAMIEGAGIDSSRIVIARPGLDPGRIGPATGEKERLEARKRLNLGPGPILLSVGRLAPHKGFGTVIRALPLLKGTWPGITYVIVGEGEEKKDLAALARELGVGDRVIFLGILPDPLLRDTYLAADLFTQPNGEFRGINEGYGMVYLEAGGAGRAVIGGRSGGVVEAVHDGVTGILVTPWDVDDFVSAVKRLLDDEELRSRMGEAGRRLTRERTWDITLAPAIEIDSRLRRA
jgi:phosphatidylinositol alpha-1,6-mannosyltransferase